MEDQSIPTGVSVILISIPLNFLTGWLKTEDLFWCLELLLNLVTVNYFKARQEAEVYRAAWQKLADSKPKFLSPKIIFVWNCFFKKYFWKFWFYYCQQFNPNNLPWQSHESEFCNPKVKNSKARGRWRWKNNQKYKYCKFLFLLLLLIYLSLFNSISTTCKHFNKSFAR